MSLVPKLWRVDVVRGTGQVVTSTAGAGAPSLSLTSRGLQGDTGPQGPPGEAQATFIHTQSTPAATWTVAHNLPFRPAVEVSSVGGAVVDAEVFHTSSTTVEIRFAAPFTGVARFN